MADHRHSHHRPSTHRPHTLCLNRLRPAFHRDCQTLIAVITSPGDSSRVPFKSSVSRRAMCRYAASAQRIGNILGVSIESQDLRHRSRSSGARTTSATQWPLFQRSQSSAFCFGVNHVRPCPSYAYRSNVLDQKERVLRRPVESAGVKRSFAALQ